MLSPAYMPYIWIAITVISILAEAGTMSLVAIWFMPSAVIAMILSLLSIPVWIQVVVFFALSFVLLVLFNLFFRKRLKKKTAATNADRAIGQECIVLEEIDRLKGTGTVRINGVVWSARRAEGEGAIPSGAVVTVTAIEGVKVLVKESN